MKNYRKRLVGQILAGVFLLSSCSGKEASTHASSVSSSSESSTTTSPAVSSADTDISKESSYSNPMFQRENPLVDMIEGFLDKYAEKGDPFNKEASARIGEDPKAGPVFPEYLLNEDVTLLQKMYLIIDETDLPWLIAGKSWHHTTNDPNNHHAWYAERNVYDRFNEDQTDYSGGGPGYRALVRYIEFEDVAYVYNGDPITLDWLDGAHNWKMEGMEGEGDSYHQWEETGQDSRYEMIYTSWPDRPGGVLSFTVFSYDREELKYYEIMLEISFSDDASSEEGLLWMEKWFDYMGFEVPIRECASVAFSS